MLKLLIITIFLSIINALYAIDINADLFSYDKNKVENEFKELSKIEAVVKENPSANAEELKLICPDIINLKNLSVPELNNNTEIEAPGKFPSFWFTFMFSAVGTYFIYGVAAGPIATGIVYFSTHKDKIETRKAIWGCVTGTLIGGGIKWLVVNL